MLKDLFTEDEDVWDLRQHQGNCCNNFIIRFIFIELKLCIKIINSKLNVEDWGKK